MVDIVKMTKKHINEVAQIEKECFKTPWSKKSFEKELSTNKHAIYVVAVEENKVIGYGGMWHVINEGHITNIAVSKSHQRKGIGTLILEALMKIAFEKEMIGLTLEVRVNNEAAKKLYKNFGFKEEGIRKEYYSDTLEDALIMWKYLIDENKIENL